VKGGEHAHARIEAATQAFWTPDVKVLISRSHFGWQDPALDDGISTFVHPFSINLTPFSVWSLFLYDDLQTITCAQCFSSCPIPFVLVLSTGHDSHIRGELILSHSHDHEPVGPQDRCHQRSRPQAQVACDHVRSLAITMSFPLIDDLGSLQKKVVILATQSMRRKDGVQGQS
jgi:hypothetical protein